jgi:hypothetical protein
MDLFFPLTTIIPGIIEIWRIGLPVALLLPASTAAEVGGSFQSFTRSEAERVRE